MPEPTVEHRRRLHHVAFNVVDVSAAIHLMATVFGVGPFLRLVNHRGDDPSHVGPAFAVWSGVFIELKEPGPGGAIGFDHVSYLTDRPEEESRRLAALGHEKFFEARLGPIWPQFHRLSALGCAVEVHADGPELRALFDRVQAAAEGWDGRDPERHIDLAVVS